MRITLGSRDFFWLRVVAVTFDPSIRQLARGVDAPAALVPGQGPGRAAATALGLLPLAGPDDGVDVEIHVVGLRLR